MNSELLQLNLDQIIFFFILYSFAGWCIEFAFRSVEHRQPVNPGLLYGPFLPLYGTAALILLFLNSLIGNMNPFLLFLVFGITATALEYLAGYLTGKYYGTRLWDYDDEPFNIKGRVCLKYSLVWAALSFAFVKLIHPLSGTLIKKFNNIGAVYAIYAIFLLIAADFLISSISMRHFMQRIKELSGSFLSLTDMEFSSLLKKVKRQQKAFNFLRMKIESIISMSIRENLMEKLSEFGETLEERLGERKPFDEEYYSIVNDILSHDEFRRLDDFRHHNSTILNHVKAVSYLSYRLCKYFGLDYVSAARGALLHDFFHYDWRKRGGRPYKGGMHGLRHSMVALKSAQKFFNLNPLEKDIIHKHMWPLTLRPPRYRESFIVNFVDKYVSSREIIDGLKNNGSYSVKVS